MCGLVQYTVAQKPHHGNKCRLTQIIYGGIRISLGRMVVGGKEGGCCLLELWENMEDIID